MCLTEETKHRKPLRLNDLSKWEPRIGNSRVFYDVILILPDGRGFLLAEIDDLEREIELIRENEELMKFLDERSKNPRTFTLNEVREQLGLK